VSNRQERVLRRIAVRDDARQRIAKIPPTEWAAMSPAEKQAAVARARQSTPATSRPGRAS
jgi:hypothetical protein